MKQSFADEIMQGMQEELNNDDNVSLSDLNDAIDNISYAAEAFEEAGLYARADELVSFLEKIAKSKKVIDKATKGLNSKKMIKNYKNRGSWFNGSDKK